MIRDFETWTSSFAEQSALEDLSERRVAIEAAHYLNSQVLGYPNNAKEPLVPAIGGLPLIMKHQVEADLQKFAQYEIEPYFVFSGLDYGKKEDPFRHTTEQSHVNTDAWDLYNRHEADQAVQKFRDSTYITAEDLFSALQLILTQNNVSFQVAPYSAWAQLAYMEKFCGEYFNAVAGAPELLLFQCNKVITSWDFNANEFRWISRAKCVADLKRFTGNADVTDEMFVDACMLAGNSMIPTHPNLDQPSRNKVVKPLGAIDLMMQTGRTGISVCLNFQEDPRFQRQNYVDKYRKARFAVKHHPVLTANGKVEPLDASNVPNDVHEFIGQRLPDELYFYLSRGIISSRVLNWRTSGEIIEVQPLDGGDSDEYRELVSSQLTPLRVSAIALLSSALHRFYQHKDMTLKCWFTEPQRKIYTSTISMKDLNLPDVRSTVSKWNVKEHVYGEVVSKFKGHGILGSAILSLKDPKFTSKTAVAKEATSTLSSPNEVLYNAIWRFLSLREYVDANHKLTPWGEVLAATIAALNGNSELEEPAVIAVELLRHDLLTTRHMFPYGGSPMRGSESDRRNNLLVSRVACLGTLRHKAIGFTGPLSQHLLAYHSMVSAVRNSIRDLVEVSMTQMFLSNDADRNIVNGTPDLGLKLPFLLENDCALGIAVKSYLDELVVQPDPTSADAKIAVMETASNRYFPQCIDLSEDMKTAFKLWDVVYAGIKVSGSLVKERTLWDEVDEWLARMR